MLDLIEDFHIQDTASTANIRRSIAPSQGIHRKLSAFSENYL